ncbi:MAG: serine/threonine protein kinase [Elusimicrobia bacterium]|nr:serine/threonine protein kinase [Elusimicrobiota bacterium]
MRPGGRLDRPATELVARGLVSLSLCALLGAHSLADDHLGGLERLRSELAARRGSRPPGPVSGRAGLDRREILQDEILEAVDEIIVLARRLQAMQGGYGASRPGAGPGAQRDQLRSELWLKYDRLSGSLLELNVVSMSEQARLMGAALSGGGGADAGRRTVDLQRFYGYAQDIRNGLSLVLRTDDALYANASRARRGAARTAGAAAGALILTLAGLGYRRWRRAAVAPALGADPAAAVPAGMPSVGARREFDGIPRPGALLGGNYRVECELGRGGMGVVLAALDLGLDRKVAIKLMREESSGGREGLARFLSEARLVAKLQHPNIVKIHTVFQEGAAAYLVFELVGGSALSARLARGARLSLEQAQDIVRQTAAALDYAHSERVIHRDLKPGNIMLADRGLVKVMDFGLAHQARVSAARLTRADAWGTPPYMAPEQELGEVSRESDIFSLGVCLYEMLTGRLPYEGPNYLAQKRERRFAPASILVPTLPKGLDALIARALSPQPRERYPCAAELAAALEDL